MRIYFYIIAMAFALLQFTSCQEEELDRNSIFTDEPTTEKNSFDQWLKKNYTDTYNIKLIYRLEDMETDFNYTLAPADFIMAQKLAKVVKYTWLEAYDEVAGLDFTCTYVPKIIHMVGSPAYEETGSVALGQAEGGLKITLYMVNYFTLDAATLNSLYFETMHHEFVHILHQTKNYDTEFQRISEGNYVDNDWYLSDDEEAQAKGFVNAYASSQPDEDFAETIAIYVSIKPTEWEELLSKAGENGASLIVRKLNMARQYMSETWNINLDELRNVTQRRLSDVTDGTLDLSPVATLDETD